MKIEREDVPQMTIEEFAEKHDLVMEVRERPYPVGSPGRYYASFKNSDTMEDGCIVGTHGDGPTPEAAIKDYAAELSLKRLVLNAFTKQKRIEINVPRLVQK